MIGNPFVALWEDPVATLTAAAYALVLLAALLGTWYALGRNLVYLYDRYQRGWILLPPLTYVGRSVGVVLLLAIDLLLIAGVIHLLTTA